MPQVLFPGKAHIGRRLAKAIRQKSGERAVELAGDRRRTVEDRLDLAVVEAKDRRRLERFGAGGPLRAVDQRHLAEVRSRPQRCDVDTLATRRQRRDADRAFLDQIQRSRLFPGAKNLEPGRQRHRLRDLRQSPTFLGAQVAKQVHALKQSITDHFDA